VSTPSGRQPPWLPPIEARVPLLVVRRHWLSPALDLVLPALLATVILAVSGYARLLNASVVLVVLVVAAVWAALVLAQWYAISFTLTPRTMVFRRGLVVRSCRIIALETLQDVTTHQSIMGSLFGYGNVELSMASGVVEQLTTVPDPELVRDRIFATRLDGAPRS
jgi:membrane protein YdbS with pleckstrin-like domain